MDQIRRFRQITCRHNKHTNRSSTSIESGRGNLHLQIKGNRFQRSKFRRRCHDLRPTSKKPSSNSRCWGRYRDWFVNAGRIFDYTKFIYEAIQMFCPRVNTITTNCQEQLKDFFPYPMAGAWKNIKITPESAPCFEEPKNGVRQCAPF